MSESDFVAFTQQLEQSGATWSSKWTRYPKRAKFKIIYGGDEKLVAVAYAPTPVEAGRLALQRFGHDHFQLTLADWEIRGGQA